MSDSKNKRESPGSGSSGAGRTQSGWKDVMNKPQGQPAMRRGDETDEGVVRRGADIENPDLPGPEKTVNPDDDPDETRRKIPNLNEK